MLLFSNIRPSSSLALPYWGRWNRKESFCCPVFAVSFTQSSLWCCIILEDRDVFVPGAPMKCCLAKLALSELCHFMWWPGAHTSPAWAALAFLQWHFSCPPGQHTALTQQLPPPMLQTDHVLCSGKSSFPHSLMHWLRPHHGVAEQEEVFCQGSARSEQPLSARVHYHLLRHQGWAIQWRKVKHAYSYMEEKTQWQGCVSPW